MKAYLSKSIKSGRVRWMLEEVGAAFEEPQGPNRPRSLPALVDGDLEITEWPAILMHLADKHPEKKLAPPVGSEDRARYYRLLSYIASTVDPALERVAVRTLLIPEPTRVPMIDDDTRKRLGEAARTLDELLGGRDFAVDGAFSAADVALGSAAAWLDFFKILSEQPRLAAYARRLGERPAYQRTHGALVQELGTVKRLPVTQLLRAGTGAPLFFAARPNQDERSYADLLPHLHTKRPLWLLQFVYAEEPALGRPYSEEEFQRWARMYLGAMREVQPTGKLHVAGVCEGAQIAYRIARLVEAEGETLGFLGFFDTWPEENTRHPVFERVHQVEQALRGFLDRAPRKATVKLRRALDKIAPDPRLAAQAAARPAAAPAPAPTAPMPRPQAASVDQWTARAAPKEPFVPRPIRSKITVFRSNTQPYWRIRDPECGWGSRTTGGVEVHEIQGNHLKVLRDPHAPIVAQKLTLCLRQLDGEQAK